MIAGTATRALPEVHLSSPSYLRLNSAPFDGVTLSIREHLVPVTNGKADPPLILVTFHPGYLTGSYRGRDYFERLAPYLFRLAGDKHRLRLFTINHPGYDPPREQQIDRFRLEPYSVEQQPLAMGAALRWLFKERLANEPDISWLAYGHSMGGLALSRCDLDEAVSSPGGYGPEVNATKILSAPAFLLAHYARSGIGRLDALNALKQTVGRLPAYGPAAIGLYRALAPSYFLRDAPHFSIDGLHDYCDFSHLDPFLLLEQGRELIRFDVQKAGGADLLAESHLVIGHGDKMLDIEATLTLVEAAREQGHEVTVHRLDSTHLPEWDVPEEVAGLIWRVAQGK